MGAMKRAWAAALMCAWAQGAMAEPLTVSACGDVMIQNQLSPRLSDAALLSYLSQAGEAFRASDIGLANLEGPIGGREPKRCASAHCHAFSQGPLTPRALKEAGIGAVSLANNHANDMGASGRRETLLALDAAGIHAAGLFERPAARWEVKGRRVALLSFTANSFAPDARKIEHAKAAIAKEAEGGALVIVAAHMGGEGAGRERMPPGAEMYLGENRGDPAAFARAAIEAGASLVVGHGPHVPRALELHQGRLIAYSLGNCATGPGISTAGPSGWAPVLRVSLGERGEALAWRVEPFIQTAKGLAPDPQRRAERLMMELSRERLGAEAFGRLDALRAR